MTSSNAGRRGVVGGILAATAVALWFLVMDVWQGEPLRTPEFLANLLAGRPGESDAGLGLLVLFALLHYAAFIALGVVAAWALDRTTTPPMVLLGLALGVLLFDLVFYAGLVLRGVDIIDALGWPQLLAGNLVGGIALMAYLQATSPQPVLSWHDVLRRYPTVREGIVAGLLGGAAVALWFLLVDLASRELFFTPAALGSALFLGARGAEQVVMSVGIIAGYTALHFLAFVVIGLVAAALAMEAERHAYAFIGGVLLFVTLETLFLGLAAIAAGWLLDALTWWNVIGSNVVAAAVMGGYIWKAHPALSGQLRKQDAEDELVAESSAREPRNPAADARR